MRLDILASKPRDNDGNLHVVVDRGARVSMRYVSATANQFSITNGEWFWGHYFATADEALAHFNAKEGAAQ